MGDEMMTERYCEELEGRVDRLVRALYDAEWMAEEWDWGGGENVCGWCWSHAPRDQAFGFIGPRERAAPRHHKPDCEFIATIRDAGFVGEER